MSKKKKLSLIFLGLVLIGVILYFSDEWFVINPVIFHIHAVTIPITIIMAVLVFLMWSSFTSVDSSVLLDPNLDEEDVFSLLGSFFVYVMLLAFLGVGFAIWALIVTIKAVKTVHGFGTAKAIGLIILVAIITSFASIPFSFA